MIARRWQDPCTGPAEGRLATHAENPATTSALGQDSNIHVDVIARSSGMYVGTLMILDLHT